MIDYDIKYVDDSGDYQDKITSTDVRTAMMNAFELCLISASLANTEMWN